MDKHGVKPNRYFQFWLPVIGLHMLHQVEESISFFQWYVDHAAEIPGWLSIPIANYDARMSIEHPEYFIFLTLGQLFLVSSAAFLSRRNEKATKILLLLYIAGLAFFLVWHVLVSYFTHSYSPIMVTCLAGLYLIPVWVAKIIKVSK